MSSKFSRKDKILALITSSNITKVSDDTASHKIHKPMVFTNINKVWSRPYDFKDFPSIYNNRKEYENSFSFIQTYDLNQMQCKLWEEMKLNIDVNLQTEPPKTIYINSHTPQMESIDINLFSQQNDHTSRGTLLAPSNTIDATKNQKDIDATSEQINIKATPQQTDIEALQQTSNTMDGTENQKVIDATSQPTDIDATPQQTDIQAPQHIYIDASPRQIHIEATFQQKESSPIIAVAGPSKIALGNKKKSTRPNLRCYETMISSDEDEDLYTTKYDLFENSDDSVQDKNYEPNFSDSDLRCPNTQLDINQTHAEAVNVHTPQNEIHHVDATVESSSDIITEVVTSNSIELNIIDSGKGFTKAGLPRKRRMFEEPLNERVKQKKQKEMEKLSLKPPCGSTCRKKCSTKFTNEIRKDIHKRYVSLNWEGRGLFIKGFVTSVEVKLRTAGKENKKRQTTNKYYLNKTKSERIEVCKTFFLTTLGYDPKNDRHLHLALSKPVDEQQDKRGKYERQNVIDRNLIKEHIQSFHPTISHYRREHAPNRLYLPSDVNITLMHEEYMKKYSSKPVSLETYRQTTKQMNISFTNLGHEECEACAIHKQHITIENGCEQESCETCINYNNHNIRYEATRKEYSNDKIRMNQTDNACICYSVDLQKVIMLPRMDQYKAAIFCRRIVAFNESFVPLGPSKNENVPYAVLWNETVAGRNQEDIISAIRAFLLHKRDVNEVILWADNCAAQNKNWALMSFLVNIINSDLIAAKCITVKYFEPGHSYMSADHFHHQVEKQLKKMKKVFDFDDFVDAVAASNAKKNVVKVMTIADFFNYGDLSSQHLIRKREPRVYFKDIMAIKVNRGNYTLQFKNDHESEWQELNFLQKKILKTGIFPNITMKSAPRGITSERKTEIISKLLPLMPETRRLFWENLPVTNNASDLL